MRALFLITLVAFASFAQGRFDRVNSRCVGGRSDRGFGCEDYAWGEFAPSSGAGMTAPCACTSPTGAKGEVLTLARGSDATCSKQGLATTGIANGDLATCTGTQPRVEPSGGVAGLRVNGAATNVLTRFIEFTNAAWADVGTPTPTTGQTSPWTGTYASSAVQYDDNDGAAYEGRTQTVTVTAAAAYTMSCYVKAGTLSSWTLSLDGTTASGTGLSSSTWSLVSVTDASTSGVAVAAQVLNGSTTGATGTVIWGGCQVESGSEVTPMVPTVGTGAARNAESPYLTIPAMTAGTYCSFANFETAVDVTGTNRRVVTLYQSGGVWTDDYFPAPRYTAFLFDGVTTSVLSTQSITTSGRVGSYYDLANLSVCVNGVCNSAAGVRTINNITRVRLGVDGAGGTAGHLNGIITRVQVDPSTTRCAR